VRVWAFTRTRPVAFDVRVYERTLTFRPVLRWDFLLADMPEE
jgi:hypothetical protein